MLSSSEDAVSNELSFENLLLEVSEDVQLKNILLELEKTVKENEQKKFIKEIVELYLNSLKENKENLEAKSCFLEFFTRFNSKKVLKKYLQDVVAKNEITNTLIEGTTKEILDAAAKNRKCNIRQCADLLNFVYYMQNSSKFDYEQLIKHLFPLYYMIFQGFVYHSKSDFEKVTITLEDLFALLNVVLKQILSIFVKDVLYIDTVSEEYSVDLMLLSYAVIVHKMVGFDIKTKAGLILTHSFTVIPEKISKKFKYKDCPPLELLEEYNTDKFTLGKNKLAVFRESEQLVIIYASILNIVPKEKLCQTEINNRNLICILYNGLVDCARRTTSIPHVIVEISRTLSIISKQMKEIPLHLMEPLFLQGISFIWSHIEHFIDSVRNYTRLFFIELVSVAAHHKANECNTLSDTLLANVKQLSGTQTLKLLGLEYIAVNMSCVYLLEHFTNLPEDLLKVISEPSITDEVCKCYVALMEKYYQEVDKETWINTWVSPVTKLLSKCAHCAPVCQRIITRAFQLYPTVLRKIFSNDHTGNLQECRVLLKCLQYARTTSTELSLEKSENTGLYWRGLIDKPKLDNFMIYQDEEIRISVLAALVDCQKSTEVFLNWELNFLIKYLQYNITSQIPHFRKQIVSYYKKAMARFNAGFHVITRTITILQRRVENFEATEEAFNVLTIYQEFRTFYRTFIEHLTRFLICNLTFDSNFPRRSISLELLLVIQGLGPVDNWQALWSEDDVKNCHSILFDSYESNKKMAAMLLKNLPASAIGFTNIEFTFKYMQRCLNIALAIKPSKTLSAAYLLEVCAHSPFFYDIVQYGQNENDTRQIHNPILDMLVVLTGKLIAQTNIEVDVCNPKVANYGILQSIRHLLQSRDMSKNNEACSGLFEHLTTICLNLKDHIMPIVCNPSPEGYLPESGEIICEYNESAKAQMILVYSWRTMKEMTMLLAEIIRQTIKLENTYEMLGDSFMIKIGEFFLDVFIATKHRGVFEQAYVGFSVICESFWTSSNPKLNSLPKMWLEDGLRLCTGEKHSDQLCATRRSAGLPFLILSILSSEPIFDKTRFHNAITKLLIACENLEGSNTEYRMHCMNVLRAMFRHSRLGEMVASYIGQGVIVAITGFKSDTWGIRNSATLLYAALMTRMFGVQRTQDSEDLCLKNRLTVRVFFMRFPELFHFLLEKLTEESSKSDSLLLHPVLMILARLYPSHFEEYNTQMEKYLPHLTTCLSNPVYRTRELAARASVSFIRCEHVPSHLDIIFNILQQANLNDNQGHGYLLQVLYILRSNTVPGMPITNYLQKSLHILKLVGKKFSHMTTTLYMEVIMQFLMKYSHYEDLEMLKIVASILSKQIISNVLPITSMSKFPQIRMSLLLFIIINKFEENEVTFSTVTNQIMCQLYGHDIEMKKYCLNLLICLNECNSGFKHALYKLEELQIPYEIVSLVNSFDKSSIMKILTNTHQYLKYFLTEEIKHQHYIRKEDQVLVFVLLNYYPCVTKHLNLSKQETLNFLINLCGCDNEELISALVSCISTFLLQVDYNVLKYEQLVQVLVESASPAASDYRRLAVCEFLAKNYILYCNEDSILTGDDLPMVLNIVMVLLEDDDIMVRNGMSEFATDLKVRITLSNNAHQTISCKRWAVMPEKAREDLLTLASIILPKDKAICFLFSWTCRHFPDTSNDASEVFERGELNSYAENVAFLIHCNRLLHDRLWTLEDGLNYEDRSIFIEEHTLIVTTILLDSLLKHPSPMMLYKTKVSVICALKSTVKFLERVEINNNFINDFRTYLNDTIIGYLTKHVEHSDLFSVKWIIKHIYEPVLIPKALR